MMRIPDTEAACCRNSSSKIGGARKASALRILKLSIILLLVCGCAAAQTGSPAGCATPELILQHYVASLGGEAVVNQVQTLVIQARESEPHTFNPASTAHYSYQLKWKSSNRVAVKQSRFLDTLHFIFDGTAWSNSNGKVSHNEDRTPKVRQKLRADYPYNDYPEFMMFRVVADPILLATNGDLYSGFEARQDPLHPGICVLRAKGTNDCGAERHDMLYFDANSGFLKTWEIQIGAPGHVVYTHFQFDDYRQCGAVRIPFSIYFDFYKATFRFTKVVPNAPLSDTEFLPKE